MQTTCATSAESQGILSEIAMHKVEVKTFQRPGGEKGRNSDPVSDKKVRKVAVDYIMKKAFDA